MISQKNRNINKEKMTTENKSLSFYLVILYLVLEYTRPQEIISIIGMLRLPFITNLLIALSVIIHGYKSFYYKQSKLFLYLIFYMMIHVVLATNNYMAFHTWKAMLMTFVVYLGIINFVDSFKKFEIMSKIWICIHVYLAIRGFLKRGSGIGGFLLDENDFCLTLNMIVAFAYYMIFSFEEKYRKFIQIFITMFFVISIMITSSRGGFLGLLAVGVYCWFRSSKKIISLVLFLLAFMLAIQFAPKGYIDRLWTIIQEVNGEKTDGTGMQREYAWGIGWKMFLDNPILGVGQGNYPYRSSVYEGGENWQGRSLAGRAAHSLYFTLLPELGFVGSLIYFGMIYFFLKDVREINKKYEKNSEKRQNRESKMIFYMSYAMEGGLIGFLVSGTFISVLYYPNFWLLMGFVVSLKNVSSQEEENVAQVFINTRHNLSYHRYSTDGRWPRGASVTKERRLLWASRAPHTGTSVVNRWSRTR